MKLEETDLVDRYCRGVLKAEERMEFEMKMEQDPQLMEKVLLHRDLLEGMDYHFNQELKSKLQRTEQGEGTAHVKSRSLFMGWAVAAGISFFFLIGYWLISGSSSPEALYHAYYQPYPNIIHPVARSGNPSDDDLGKAMMAYEQENYQEAIHRFNQQLDELTASYRFYLALSYLETSEPQHALNLLEEVIQSGDETFYLPALWYQCLSYLAEGNTEGAKPVLQKLVNAGDSVYSSKAKEILEKLE